MGVRAHPSGAPPPGQEHCIRLLTTAAMMAAFFVPAPSTASTSQHHAGTCHQSFIAATYRVTASRIYHQSGRIVPRQLYRLEHMRVCAKTPAARRAMRLVTGRQHHARRHRQQLARRDCGTPTCNRRLARWMTRANPGEFQCLDGIVSHESGWSDDVEYGGRHGPPGSLAWGIPQALPPQKMSSAGADWATSARTQIRWLRQYVRDRYGSACQALAHWRANHNY